MRKDHRPYYLKRLWFNWLDFYARHFTAPHLDSLGENPFIVKPWHLILFGGPIHIGGNVTLLASAERKINLTVWSEKEDADGIVIGDHVLISPGVRILAARSIRISDNCMIAGNVYISDADWHGIYDRSSSPGRTSSILLENNVWVGDSAIINKGVTIGENSIIGAGSVVLGDIPPNVIAAGNPARVIKPLDREPFVTRKDRFDNMIEIKKLYNQYDRKQLKGNSTLGWLRHLLFPRPGD